MKYLAPFVLLFVMISCNNFVETEVTKAIDKNQVLFQKIDSLSNLNLFEVNGEAIQKIQNYIAEIKHFYRSYSPKNLNADYKKYWRDGQDKLSALERKIMPVTPALYSPMYYINYIEQAKKDKAKLYEMAKKGLVNPSLKQTDLAIHHLDSILRKSARNLYQKDYLFYLKSIKFEAGQLESDYEYKLN